MCISAKLPEFMRYHKRGMKRIVGGHIAPKPIPWQVNIMYRSQRRCGGTLIDQTTIITAAHCARYAYANGTVVFDRLDKKPSKYSISVGTKDLLPVSTDRIRPKRIIVHPAFHSESFKNDIAIIKLDWDDRVNFKAGT